MATPPQPQTPTILVQPFPAPSSHPAGTPPMHSSPQLSTYSPGPPLAGYPRSPSPAAMPHSFQPRSAPGSPVPAYAQGDWRSAAEQEKDSYYAASSEEGHWADSPLPSHPSSPHLRQNAPGPILLPPKAAFANSSQPGSPMSPAALKKAMEFGDVSSIKSGVAGSERRVEGGRGGAEVRKSGLDWNRFGIMAEKGDGKSEWLQRKTKNSKKWFYLGWIGTICVAVAIAAGLAYHFTRPKSSSSEPTVASLGGLNDKNVTAISHTSGFGHSALVAGTSTSSLLQATSSAVAPVATAATSDTFDDEEDVEETEVEAETSVAQRVVTTTSAARTTTTAAAVQTTTTTSARALTTTSSASSSSQPLSSSSITSSVAARATRVAAAAAADERRLAKRFGASDVEWKAPGAVPASEEKRSGDWAEIKFASPHHNDKRAGNWAEVEFASPHAQMAGVKRHVADGKKRLA